MTSGATASAYGFIAMMRVFSGTIGCSLTLCTGVVTRTGKSWATFPSSMDLQRPKPLLQAPAPDRRAADDLWTQARDRPPLRSGSDWGILIQLVRSLSNQGWRRWRLEGRPKYARVAPEIWLQDRKDTNRRRRKQPSWTLRAARRCERVGTDMAMDWPSSPRTANHGLPDAAAQ